VKLCVTGGRKYSDRSTLFEVLDSTHELLGIDALGHGDAPGADALADEWCLLRGVPCERFAAEWTRYRKPGRKNPAGAIRNRLMLTTFRPDVVIAFPGGSGTADCVATARTLGITVLDLRERLRDSG